MFVIQWMKTQISIHIIIQTVRVHVDGPAYGACCWSLPCVRSQQELYWVKWRLRGRMKNLLYSTVLLMCVCMEVWCCAALKACRCQACVMTPIKTHIGESATWLCGVQSIDSGSLTGGGTADWSRPISSPGFPLCLSPSPLHLCFSHSLTRQPSLCLHWVNKNIFSVFSSPGRQLFHTVLRPYGKRKCFI